MKEKISSDYTYLRKLYWVFFFIFLLIVLFVPGSNLYDKAAGSIFCIASIYIFFSTSLELKDVEIDEHYMYVTDSRGTIQVPFSMIKNVREPILTVQKNIIIVELKIETKFGSVIKFAPRYFSGFPILRHPIINKLKRLADLDKNS
jgi:hypothetical protein